MEWGNGVRGGRARVSGCWVKGGIFTILTVKSPRWVGGGLFVYVAGTLGSVLVGMHE